MNAPLTTGQNLLNSSLNLGLGQQTGQGKLTQDGLQEGTDLGLGLSQQSAGTDAFGNPQDGLIPLAKAPEDAFSAKKISTREIPSFSRTFSHALAFTNKTPVLQMTNALKQRIQVALNPARPQINKLDKQKAEHRISTSTQAPTKNNKKPQTISTHVAEVATSMIESSIRTVSLATASLFVSASAYAYKPRPYVPLEEKNNFTIDVMNFMAAHPLIVDGGAVLVLGALTLGAGIAIGVHITKRNSKQDNKNNTEVKDKEGGTIPPVKITIPGADAGDGTETAEKKSGSSPTDTPSAAGQITPSNKGQSATGNQAKKTQEPEQKHSNADGQNKPSPEPLVSGGNSSQQTTQVHKQLDALKSSLSVLQKKFPQNEEIRQAQLLLELPAIIRGLDPQSTLTPVEREKFLDGLFDSLNLLREVLTNMADRDSEGENASAALEDFEAYLKTLMSPQQRIKLLYQEIISVGKQCQDVVKNLENDKNAQAVLFNLKSLLEFVNGSEALDNLSEVNDLIQQVLDYLSEISNDSVTPYISAFELAKSNIEKLTKRETSSPLPQVRVEIPLTAVVQHELTEAAVSHDPVGIDLRTEDLLSVTGSQKLEETPVTQPPSEVDRTAPNPGATVEQLPGAIAKPLEPAVHMQDGNEVAAHSDEEQTQLRLKALTEDGLVPAESTEDDILELSLFQDHSDDDTIAPSPTDIGASLLALIQEALDETQPTGESTQLNVAPAIDQDTTLSGDLSGDLDQNHQDSLRGTAQQITRSDDSDDSDILDLEREKKKT